MNVSAPSKPGSGKYVAVVPLSATVPPDGCETMRMVPLPLRGIETDTPAAVDALALATVGGAGAVPFPEGPLWHV